MNLDIQTLHHNYVVRMVVFSVFLFKQYRTDEAKFTKLINMFLSKKITFKVIVAVECGPKLSVEDSRENIISSLLNDTDVEHLNLVVATFKTPLKQVSMQINLLQEQKWENYLIS